VSTTFQKLESVKAFVAKICFFLNFGLGFIALPLSLIVFQIPLNYFLVGWIPTISGYSLLVGYWIEMRSSMKESYAFWVVSLVFNLIGVFSALGIAFFDHTPTALGVRILYLLIVFWTSLMSVASFYQALLSYQLNHPTEN
jgi:hypothetical protein